MPITVVCHKCGTLATVPDSAAGMQGKCERCGNVIHLPGGIVKSCCVCHTDVSNAQRTKDAAGNYYCAQCTKAKQHAMEAAAVTKPSTTPEPDNASESATCVICKADFPRKSLCNFDGDLVCNACAQHAGLGTASYRTKKMRWSGVRLVYRCPQCQCELESTLDEAGKEDRCPQCGAAFDVPGRYEKLKATRPTAVSMPQGTAVAAAPAPAASQPAASPETSAGPPPKAVMGKGKLLAISASTVGAVLVLTFMINYVVMKPNTTSPQAKPATMQANAAKPAATQAAATAKATKVQAATAATKPVAAKGTGGNAGATAMPTPPKTRLAARVAPAKAEATASRWHKIGLPVRTGDAVVTVTDVKIRDVPLIDIDGSADKSAHRLCEVFLSIHDRSTARILHYNTWRGDVIGNHQGALGDDAGNYYRQCGFGVGVKLKGQSRGTSDVYPGKTVRDVLVFERPVAAAKALQLRLPGGNIGWNHTLRFRFPVPKARGR